MRGTPWLGTAMAEAALPSQRGRPMLPEHRHSSGHPKLNGRASEQSLTRQPVFGVGRLCGKRCRLCLYLEAKKGMSAADALLRISQRFSGVKMECKTMQPVPAAAAQISFARMG